MALPLSGCVTEVSGEFVEPASRSERQRAHIKLARGYYRLGEYERADAAVTRALALGRRSAAAHEAKALIEAAFGKNVEAKAHFQTAVRLQKSSGRIWNNYGVFLYDEGEFEAACAAFKRAQVDADYKGLHEAQRNLKRCQDVLQAGTIHEEQGSISTAQ